MASPKCVSEGMQAALAWMASALAAGKGATPDGARWAARAAAQGAGYKTAPVREAAAAVMSALVAAVGGGEAAAAVAAIDNKALKQAGQEALAKAGGGGGSSAAPSMATTMAGSRPATASSRLGATATGGSARGAAAPSAASRPGTATGSRAGGSRVGSAANLTATATGGRATAASAAAAMDDGPLLAMDNKKDERAKKVGDLAAPRALNSATGVRKHLTCRAASMRTATPRRARAAHRAHLRPAAPPRPPCPPPLGQVPRHQV